MLKVNCEQVLLEYVEKNQGVVIYGAGAVGQGLVRYLLDNGIDKSKCHIVVTKIQENSQMIHGCQVYPYDEKKLEYNALPIVIAVMEDKQIEMQEKAKEDYSEIVVLTEDVCKEFVFYNKGKSKLVTQESLQYVVLNILDYCNLNCKGCDHFSPIAEKRLIPLEVIEKDVARLAEVLNQNLGIMGIMGGEPLLHPQLLDIIKVARRYFPKTRLQLATNGLLLLQQSELFWQVCRENNVIIEHTKYPINLDFDAITEKCRQESVTYEYYGESGTVIKTLYKICMDTAGKQDPRTSFLRCFHANHCVTLMEGKLYPCTVAPNVHIFNERYNENIPVTDKDYYDIYSPDASEEQALKFLSRPMPICAYCDVQHRSHGAVWEISKKEKSEWVWDDEER